MDRQFQIIPFSQIACHNSHVVEVDFLRKIRQIFLGELEHGLRKQDADKRLPHLESQRALIVRHRLSRDVGIVFRHVQTSFALATTLVGVGERFGIDLGVQPDVLRRKQRDGVDQCREGRVRLERGGDLLGSILVDIEPLGTQGLVVGQRDPDRVVHRNRARRATGRWHLRPGDADDHK